MKSSKQRSNGGGTANAVEENQFQLKSFDYSKEDLQRFQAKAGDSALNATREALAILVGVRL